MKQFSPPLVRRIEERDFERVAEITNRHFPQMRMTSSKIASRLSRGFFYFVAIVDGTVAGFVDVRLMERKAKVAGMAVDDKFRGRGVGSALLGKVLEFASERGKEKVCLKVRRDNLSALRFYGGHGFILENELGEYGETIYTLCRKLET